MNSTAPIEPRALPLPGSNDRVICVAFLATAEFTDPTAAGANLFGAVALERCLTNALRAEAVTLLHSGTANPALLRGVFLFFVPEVQPALSVIVEELRALDMGSFSVVGVFDRAEDYWRAVHPQKPLFDINARMNEVMPPCQPGEKPLPGPHPEMQRIVDICKSGPCPLPNIKSGPPVPPTAPAAE